MNDEGLFLKERRRGTFVPTRAPKFLRALLVCGLAQPKQGKVDMGAYELPPAMGMILELR